MVKKIVTDKIVFQTQKLLDANNYASMRKAFETSKMNEIILLVIYIIWDQSSISFNSNDLLPQMIWQHDNIPSAIIIKLDIDFQLWLKKKLVLYIKNIIFSNYHAWPTT